MKNQSFWNKYLCVSKYSYLLISVLLTGLFFPVFLESDEYTCTIKEYPDDLSAPYFWKVLEKKDKHLIVHVGTTNRQDQGRFHTIHQQVHGRPGLIGKRYIGDWQVAIKAAHRECQEWTKQNTRPPDNPPPIETLAPPRLTEMVVEQKHQTRETASVRIAVRADYRNIGRFGPKEILITLRIRDQSGRMILSREFCPLSSTELRVNGNSLFLTLAPELTEIGAYTIQATLVDTRLSSTAHSRLAYEDNLHVAVTIYRPVAEIMHVSGNVNIKRNDPKTASGGVRVLAGNQEVLGSDTDALLAGTIPVSPFREDPFSRDPGIACNRFLYEGDQVNLYGIADRPAFDPSRRLSQNLGDDFEKMKKFVSSGRSSIDLEWPGGASGRAVWLPALSPYTSYGKFVIGASREASGKWRSKWSDVFSQGAYFLFEQSFDYIKDKGIIWFLKVNISSVSSFITALNLSTGSGEVWDELFYIRLNSEVILNSEKDRFDIYTFEGNPELIHHKTGKRVFIPEGQMIRASASSIPSPNLFKTDELLTQLTSHENRPEPIDLDLASDILNNLMRKLDADVPELQAKISSVRFYESGLQTIPYDQRVYSIRFPAESTRYIYWEINLDYPSPNQRNDFQVESFLYRPDGALLNRQTQNYFIEPGWTQSQHSMGCGNQQAGTWSPGVYRLDLYAFGKKIFSSTFEVTAQRGDS